MTPNGCPLCGTGQHACGQPFTGTPVDLPARTENAMSGGVQRYRVTINGTDTILKLNADDAKRYAAQYGDVTPVNATADAEAVDGADDETGADAKAATVQNKARSASNKGGRGGGARDN